MLLGCLKVKTLVEVHVCSQPRLVDDEVAPQPGAEELHHLRVAVREVHRTVRLRSFARVESDSRNKERCLAKVTDSINPSLVQCFDLALLSLALRIRATVRSPPLLAGGEGNVSDPEGHAALGDAQQLGDLDDREVLCSEAAGLFLFLDLASVSHGADRICGV
ncbi:MAG: hypothetical protein FJW86_03895 [Actinobacteria bacterium]|nr:hypothetical protein [Actinomycetota bacterium]